MAAKASGLAERVHVWARRPEGREACRHMSWCDAAFEEPEKAVRGADLAVVCAPVDVIAALVERIRGAMSAGSLITDVGSTKAAICRRCGSGAEPVLFVGSHPMAGSEKSGLAHASAELFKGRPCMITPLESVPDHPVEQLKAFWEAIGMRVQRVSPEEHDRIVAHISHLPHLAASLLARQLGGLPRAWDAVAGSGLRDTTRIAAGSPAIWRSIFENNAVELLRATAGFEEQLAEFKSLVVRGEWEALEAFLADGQRFRRGLE